MSAYNRSAVSMTDEEFRLIRDLIRDYCGIFFPDSMKFLIERRLHPRLEAYAFNTFREYYRLIKYGREREKEFDEVVERVTTNETYFFRETRQLRAFTDELLPLLIASRTAEAPLRIWSAGCSTGEEPYTIAMLLEEEPAATEVGFEIFGNDISRKVLRTARAGLYTSSSFRTTNSQHTETYFERDGRTYRLCDSIRKRVTFGHLNLMNETSLSLVGDVDLIFCRNVIIYFDHPSRARLLETFHRKLRPGGYLLLGHSESLINESTAFDLVPLKNDIVYRKPLAPQEGDRR